MLRSFFVNITKQKGIVITFGVVVCFFSVELVSKEPFGVNPKSLQSALVQKSNEIMPDAECGTELDVAAELDAVDKKIERLEDSVTGHKEVMEAGRQELEKLRRDVESMRFSRCYSDERAAKKILYLEKVNEIAAALDALRRDVKTLKDKKFSVNNDINIVVGGNPTPAGSVVSSMAQLTGRLWDLVKIVGVSAGAYYLTNRILSILAEIQKEQREFYQKIIDELLKQQQRTPEKPPIKIPEYQPGFDYKEWSSVLSTAAAAVPVCWALIQWYWTKKVPPIFSIQETSKEAPSVVDAGIKAWRIIGGERIPVR